ncbi:unnamed protein product [Adineta steineri]|uniref:Apple domain-containing protein n=1 Tax=Adineta steineri TaxID=433720 RepID=A0A815VBL1_9BILA|nr:unnamed protein product [Adineta steineri]
MRNIIVFCIIITQSISQDVGTLLLTKLNNIQYQCTDPGCSSSTTSLTLNLRACEIACLVNINCRTLTFDQSNNQCQLFTDIPSQYGSLIIQADFMTLIAIDKRKLSAPMTISTTASV